MSQPIRFVRSSSPRHQPAQAIARERSEDGKLTQDPRGEFPMAATYVPQWACNPDCPFLGHGCYAEDGHMGIITGRLNASGPAAPEDIARAEAAEIRKLSGEHPLRLHVVGDCRTNEAAKIVAEATTEYMAKYDQPAWTYTHSWREVDRVSWGDVAVLASCETEADVALALERGYATALELEEDQPLPLRLAGTKALPCPQQTGGKPDCARCMICTKDDRLRGKATIIFRVHGTRRNKMGARLKELRRVA